MIFIITLCGLALSALTLFHYAKKTKPAVENLQFEVLQKKYLTAYYLATFSDWLQGPYVYKVYSDYGYEEEEIAVLYIAGFASSSLFGTVVGHLADKYGRKILCVSFGFIYSICCLSKLSSEFYCLLLGRVLGGISTSILFSTFEAWYINEHINHFNLPPEWLNITFSKASFSTGFLAIMAGIISQIFADTLNLGAVSPFIIAIPFLLMCSYFVLKSWNEHPPPKTTLNHSFLTPVYLILCQDRNLLVLSLIQSMFEAVMYTFIYSWTPIISELKPPLGIVFSSFMLAFMIGSKVYGMWLSHQHPPQLVLVVAAGCSFISLAIVGQVISYVLYSSQHHSLSVDSRKVLTQICFVCFVLYEMCLGVYFPVMGYLKSRVIPEEYRASMANWFRAPMNLFTCISLTFNRFNKSQNNESYSPSVLLFEKFNTIYMLCSVFLLFTTLASLEFKRRYTNRFRTDELLYESKDFAQNNGTDCI